MSIIAAVDSNDAEVPLTSNMAATHTLKLPGGKLFLTPLLKAKKYRNYGHKQGALTAWEKLEESGLGRVEKTDIRGIGVVSTVCFEHVDGCN